MRQSHLHPLGCPCRACAPVRSGGGADALAIGSTVLILITVALIAFCAATGVNLESLASWECSPCV